MAKKAKQTKIKTEPEKVETSRLEVKRADIKKLADEILAIHPTANKYPEIIKEALNDLYIKISTSIASRHVAAKLDAAPKPLTQADINRIANEYQAEIEKAKKEEEEK